MSIRRDLNTGEKVIGSATTSLYTYEDLNLGIRREVTTPGTLFLSHEALAFLAANETTPKTSLMDVRDPRNHVYHFMMIRAVRTESRGMLTGEEFLVIETRSDQIHKYSCKREDCRQLKKIVADYLASRSSIKKLDEEMST
ncbi:MAG: hypothetical protein ACFFFK_03635 [Candidatus Thorarchaeota archaeon]